MFRRTRGGEPQSRTRYNSEAMIVRTVGTVNAGVYFFSPPLFLRQEPRRQERERLMVMPAKPVANLILRQPGVNFVDLEKEDGGLASLGLTEAAKETLEVDA